MTYTNRTATRGDHGAVPTEATGAARPTRGKRPLIALLAAVMATLLVLASCSSEPEPEPTPTPTPTREYPYVERPSGLFWDSGVFGHDTDLTQGFADMRGRDLDVLGVSPTRGSWRSSYSDWWLTEDTIPKGFKGTLNVSLQLFPEGGSLEAAARGEYNSNFQHLGRMIAREYPDAYVRPGWEFNIENWLWKATPENVGVWKEAFRQASISLNKGGPDLRIVWNPNEGKGNSLPDATQAWPGDDVVDIVGLDAYDWSPPYDEKGWAEHKGKDQGWDFWAKFARDHGKMFALPEWGVIAGSEQSGGDNPKYIDYVMQWMVDNRDIMAFETYFEEPADYCKCALTNMNPQARQAYLDWMPKITQMNKPTATPTPTPSGSPSVGSGNSSPATVAPSTAG
ncbi:MAG: hypothetical protein Q4G51_06070 [Dermatophilus congolensis]|nr:hypothetical protein [Dermatophilus congolensis]